jgi:hypothetical protein
MRRLAPLLFVALLGCGAFDMPENVDISIDSPVSVGVDEEFQIVLTINNTGPSTQTLVDLDVADAYLEGVVVREIDPTFSDAMHVPFDNTQSYSMDLALPAAQTVKVTISAYAAHVGDFGGDIDFCINSAVACLSYPVRTIIR